MMIGWNKKMGANIVFKSLDPGISFNDLIIAGEIPIEDISTPEEQQISKMFNDFEELNPYDYLSLIEAHIPDKLISTKNYTEIKNLANLFKNNITSFFGFETKLTSKENKLDYLIAISSKKGERESLLELLETNNLPESIMKLDEWKNIYNFTKNWANPESILYNNILGIWFEFDASSFFDGVLVPNIFLQTRKIRADSSMEIKKIEWITKNAIPLLTGKHVSKTIEKRFIEAIQNLPEGTALIHFGTMISRANMGIRIVINRIKSKQIIPYLNSIGWKDPTDELSKIINELDKFVSRIILHITIGENVSQKIGLECSFSKDKYHMETEWLKLLEYLINKNLCTPEKKHALLNFIGINNDEVNHDVDISSYIPSVLIKNNPYKNILVRFISHIKIVYQPNKLIETKAYPGIRLLGKPTEEI